PLKVSVESSGQQPAGTRTRQSQLSQTRTQLGQFTYHPDFTDIDQNECVPIILFDEVNLTSSGLWVSKEQTTLSRTLSLTKDRSFFESIKQSLIAGQYEMLMMIVNESYYHFAQPTSMSLDFLRQLLRVYPKFIVDRFGSGPNARR